MSGISGFSIDSLLNIRENDTIHALLNLHTNNTLVTPNKNTNFEHNLHSTLTSLITQPLDEQPPADNLKKRKLSMSPDLESAPKIQNFITNDSNDSVKKQIALAPQQLQINKTTINLVGLYSTEKMPRPGEFAKIYIHPRGNKNELIKPEFEILHRLLKKASLKDMGSITDLRKEINTSVYKLTSWQLKKNYDSASDGSKVYRKLIQLIPDIYTNIVSEHNIKLPKQYFINLQRLLDFPEPILAELDRIYAEIEALIQELQKEVVNNKKTNNAKINNASQALFDVLTGARPTDFKTCLHPTTTKKFIHEYLYNYMREIFQQPRQKALTKEDIFNKLKQLPGMEVDILSDATLEIPLSYIKTLNSIANFEPRNWNRFEN